MTSELYRTVEVQEGERVWFSWLVLRLGLVSGTVFVFGGVNLKLFPA